MIEMSNKTLKDYNDEIIEKLYAPLAYLFFMFILGVPGNGLIVIIYRKSQKNVYRRIIWTIGVVDFVFCLIGAPFNIARLYHYFTFASELTCQIVTSSMDTGMMISTHLLLLLTVYRFWHVCFPMKPQITYHNIRYFIIGSFIIGVCLGLPQLVVLQPLAKTDFGNNITGYSCSVAWKDSPRAWKNYNIFLTSLFLFYALLLFILYALIGRTVYLQAKKHKRGINTKESTNANHLSNKMTQIAFTVSIVFAASYLPLFLNEFVSIKADEEGNTALFAAMIILQRSYHINHVANPFIYAIFDDKFRASVKNLSFRCLPCCKGQDYMVTNTSDKQNSTSTTGV